MPDSTRTRVWLGLEARRRAAVIADWLSARYDVVELTPGGRPHPGDVLVADPTTVRRCVEQMPATGRDARPPTVLLGPGPTLADLAGLVRPGIDEALAVPVRQTVLVAAVDTLARALRRDAAASSADAHRLALAVTAGRVGLWDWDLVSNRLSYSAEWKRQIGYDEHEIGDGFDEWSSRVHPEDLGRCLEQVNAFLANPWSDYQLEFRFRHRDGSYRWISANAQAERDSAGRVRRMFGSHVDVTDARELKAEAELARRATLAKSQFIATLSHEVRTPLNSIIGFAEVLRAGMVGEVPAEQKRFVDDIWSAGKHLHALINDALDLARIEAGRMELVLASQDVAELLQSALLVVRERSLERSLTLEVVCDAEVDRVVLDARKVRQALFNLLSNAVKFSPDGGTVVTHARSCRREDVRPRPGRPGRLLGPPEAQVARFLELSVSDDGPGLSQVQMDGLFEPFVQAKHADRQRQHEGSGLGLYLVRRLVELHRGAVGVESRAGQGCRFVIWLPDEQEI